MNVRGAIRKRWGLFALLFFLCCVSPSPCIQTQPPPARDSVPATPSDSSRNDALIAAAAAICVALISSATALLISRREIRKANPISPGDLIKENNITAIRDAGHFVRERDILNTLMLEVLTTEWERFRRLILDQSEVSQMIDKSLAEKIDTTRQLFNQLGGLGGSPKRKED
jgi:hypothetical protein